jgi:hypothetical protein
VLGIDVLQSAVPGVYWRRIQASGIAVPHDEAEKLEGLWLERTRTLHLTEGSWCSAGDEADCSRC